MSPTATETTSAAATPGREGAMRGVSSGISAWFEPVSYPTYRPGNPDPNPMFLEKRVYQGSSGRVYPLPFIDRVSPTPEDQTYAALHLENEWLYVMALPEIGGRIHIGFDKLAGYDFFYRQNVIKPALVGLAGPWISGGVEFNWPQHHRPSTYMPCAWWLEEGESGDRTFWMSEHEPMDRMKGMHGVCLRPGSTLIELRARLYNRTPQTRTFLWWANVAARVHEAYQSFFPPDVRFVADHAKRATSAFPACADRYYGVPYGDRAAKGVPADETPSMFPLPEGVDPNRLDWYANIPVPTSYMVVSTAYEFFGGYDHAAEAGFVHVADRHISPGKKQWTWGNHEFGYAWDRNLTDEGGPYVELMAGVYTDNQPDFSFLAPYETKTFSQYWYPIRKIGIPVAASRHAALAVEGNRIGICPSSRFAGAQVEIEFADALVERVVDLDPAHPFLAVFGDDPIAVRVLAADGERLVSYDAREVRPQPAPESATEPPAPEEVASTNELYLIGLHLEQYRHATRAPEPYWQEALRRDPQDAPCHTAMGRRLLSRGLYEDAEIHLRAAVSSQTRRNPNPNDGEALYSLGLCLERQFRYVEAAAAYGKASWNYGWKAASQLALARLATRERRWSEARSLLAQARNGIADANIVHTLEAAILRQQGQADLAKAAAERVLAYDPLDTWALYEAASIDSATYGERFRQAMQGDVQFYLDLAFDFLSCGLDADASEVLRRAPGNHPIVALLQGRRAKEADVLTGLFPNRPEEMRVLEVAVRREPADSVAHALLGHLYYDRRRYDEAIAQWEAAVQANPGDAVAWRNLGIAYHNVRRDPARAKLAYDRAVAAYPADARLVYERDQLAKRTGVAPTDRLRDLEPIADLVASRDDLTLELASLYNQTGQPDRAARLLQDRVFAPWEGGEGIALGVHARTHTLLARRATDAADRVRHLEEALRAPRNLGEDRHLLANASDLWVALGDALAEAGRPDEAARQYRRAAEFEGDFQEMAVRTFSEMTLYKAQALRKLGRADEAEALLIGLRDYALRLEQAPAKIDYFATSLPTMLLFDEDLSERQVTTARFLRAQAAFGLGQTRDAEALLDEVLQRDPNHALAQDLRAAVQG